MLPLHLLLTAVVGRVAREQYVVIEYLKAENLVLKAQLRGRRVCLSDAERRRLAILGARLGRPTLTQVTTLVTADTILRWRRDLSARKWTVPKRRPGRPRLHAEIRGLGVRMATENPTWGYTRIQGAFKNLEYRVARSTVANILKEDGIPPSGKRPTSWRTFFRAHWGAIVGADCRTADVRTLRTWLTYSALCATELRSRGVPVMASPPHSHKRVWLHVVRPLTGAADAELVGARGRICDRGSAWTTALEHTLPAAGAHPIRAPVPAPNCHARALPFVSSLQEGPVNRLVPRGEGCDRRTLAA